MKTLPTFPLFLPEHAYLVWHWRDVVGGGNLHSIFRPRALRYYPPMFCLRWPDKIYPQHCVFHSLHIGIHCDSFHAYWNLSLQDTQWSACLSRLPYPTPSRKARFLTHEDVCKASFYHIVHKKCKKSSKLLAFWLKIAQKLPLEITRLAKC